MTNKKQPKAQKQSSTTSQRKRKPSPQASVASRPPKDSKKDTKSSSTTAKAESAKLSVVTRIDDLAKFEIDPNQYRVILLSNGLKVALISRRTSAPTSASSGSPPDEPNNNPSKNGQFAHNFSSFSTFPSTVDVLGISHSPTVTGDENCDAEFTSVALVINVGGTSDPLDCQGLAHFLEHMVHYGSKQYPDVETYFNLIQNFGDGVKAFTNHLLSTYTFQVGDEFLEKSLDLLSNMLSEPLLEEEHLDREVNSVDDEFYWKHASNAWDINLLPRYLTLPENHPMSKFYCGTKESLGSGAKVKEVMTDFHRKNYVATAMTACINSTKSLDELENLALNHFSTLLQGEHKTYQNATDKVDPEPIVWRNCDKKIVLQGMDNYAGLEIWWLFQTSTFTNEPQEVVLEMILTMLSDTSNQSLDYHLQEKGLVWNQNVHVYYQSREVTFIRLVFSLTQKGRENMSQIFQTTFQFLDKLQSTSEHEMRRLFDELLVQNLNAFCLRTLYRKAQYTIGLATDLQFLADEKGLLLGGWWENARFNYQRVVSTLQKFTKEDFIVLEIIPKDIPIEDWVKKDSHANFIVERAPHTNSPYILVPRQDDWILRKENNDSSNHQFGIVPENFFLLEKKLERLANDKSSTFINYDDIKPRTLEWKSSGNTYPKVTGEHTGHVAKSLNHLIGSVRIEIVSQVLHSCPKNYALGRLWSHCLHYNNAVNHCAVRLAGYNSALCEKGAIGVNIDGLPNSMMEIVEVCVSMFRNPITDNMFLLAKERLKDEMESGLRNFDDLESMAYECMVLKNQELFLDSFYHIENCTLEDLHEFIAEINQTSYVNVRLTGNIPITMFYSIARLFEKYPFTPVLGDPKTYVKTFEWPKPLFPPGRKCIRIKSKSMSRFCTKVRNWYIFDELDQHHVDLLRAALNFMDIQALLYLRMRYQLGYIAGWCRVDVHESDNGKLFKAAFGVHVIATAKKFSPCELDDKIDEFLAFYSEYLKTIKKEEFEKMRKLKNVPAEINLDEVICWFSTIFNPVWNQNMVTTRSQSHQQKSAKEHKERLRKLSIQVVGKDAKCCCCARCQSISDWKSSPHSNLLLATGSGATNDYFVDNFNEASTM